MKLKTMLLTLFAISAILFSTATVYGYYGSQRVSGWQLLDEIIDSRHYVNGSIDNEHVSASCINSSQIVDYTIANADISPTAGINSSQIADGTIANADVAASAINSSQILDSTIANADIAASAINSSQIIDGTIANADIAPNTINNSQIQASAVNDTQLSANAIMGATNSLTAVQNVLGTTYVDVINKTITLNRTSMVIVTYSAETKTTTGDGNLTFIRVQLGGVAMTPNIEARFPNQTYYVASSYMFYNSSVVSGTHNVNISARAINAAETVSAINQSLVIIAVPA